MRVSLYMIGLTVVLGMFAIGCEQEGAPDVPHAVSSTDDQSCRGCHANSSSGAPQSPHPGRTNCVGCHHVVKVASPTDGGADAGAPPGIPHAIASNDDSYCLSCHKDGLNGAKKTPHPERTGCRGCHQPI
jgi:hypothetical protein